MSSTSTKYDPDLLKSDVTHAKVCCFLCIIVRFIIPYYYSVNRTLNRFLCIIKVRFIIPYCYSVNSSSVIYSPLHNSQPLLSGQVHPSSTVRFIIPYCYSVNSSSVIYSPLHNSLLLFSGQFIRHLQSTS